MTVHAPVLIVEDDVHFASAFAGILNGRAPARIAVTVADARAEFHSASEFSAALIDVSLPDGSGLDVLEEARVRFPRLPVLVITGSLDRKIINRAQLLGAEFAFKQDELLNVWSFLNRVFEERNQAFERRSDSLEKHIAARKRTLGLSSQEEEVLRLEVSELPRKRMAEMLGVSEDALKRVVRGIAEKADGVALATIAREIRAELLGGSW